MKIIIRILVTLFIVMIADSMVGRLSILSLTNGGLENSDTIWSWSIVRVAVTLWCGIKWGWNNPRVAPKKRVIDVNKQNKVGLNFQICNALFVSHIKIISTSGQINNDLDCLLHWYK